jgi:hypothetical protein
VARDRHDVAKKLVGREKLDEMAQRQPLTRSRAGLLTAALLVVAYGWWATGFREFTIPSEIGIGVPILAVLVSAALSGRPRSATADAHGTWRRGGALTWVVVLAVFGAWELLCYLMAPRSSWPTASSMLASIDASHGARLLVFLVWIVLGWDVARR